jgi:5'-deoxynucleotidase
LTAGNAEFAIAAEKLAQDIAAIDQPEVKFFMQSFAPNCGLTLDDLMAKR